MAASGYIRTSRIRFSTLEPKLYKLLKVRGKPLAGPLSVTFLDQGDAEAGSVTFAAGANPGNSDITITSPVAPQDYLSLKFTMSRSATVNTSGAEISGYQLKALPGGTRQRLIRLPLLVYDFEKDTFGNKRGQQGTALNRLMALEDLENVGGSVVLQDIGGGISLNCVIESIQFQQDTPPPGQAGFGGVANVTLRTV